MPWSHQVLPSLSAGYPWLRGTLAIHYSPVRHWTLAGPVRLACLSHAASVQAEPGSNSSIEFLGTNHSCCPASLLPLAEQQLTETDAFAIRVYPRNEFVQ